MKQDLFKEAADWLNGQKRDFCTGLDILEQAGFKPAVVRKLARDGAHGPAAAERLEFQVREYVKAYGINDHVPDTDPELHVFDGQEAPADHGETQQLRIMDAAAKLETGELEVQLEQPRRVIHEYAAAYRQREKAMRLLAEAGEDNDEATMARRKELSDTIDQATALMERLYPLYERYQTGADLQPEDVEKALEPSSASAGQSAAQDSGAAHTSGTGDLQGKSREELARLRKNAGVRLLRTENKLLYQAEKKLDTENPMPDGPERVKLEARAENIRKEIEAIDMAIAQFG